MTCKDVTSQAELDAALVDNAVSCIRVKSKRGVWLRINDNKARRIEIADSASVRAYNSASVRAYNSASVEAHDSASVRAYNSANVEAYDSTRVQAFDSTRVQAYDSTRVQAFDSTRVQAYGSAGVRAYDSASVRAYDLAGVHARDRAKITASPHVAVHLHSACAIVEGGVVIDLTALDFNDARTWCDHQGVDVVNGRAVLYKALPADLTSGREYDQVTVYEVGAELVAGDWQPTNECGGGLHLSPRPHQAARYQSDAKRYLRCSAALEDLVPIDGSDLSSPKAKVRALRVEAEVDAFGHEVVTP